MIEARPRVLPRALMVSTSRAAAAAEGEAKGLREALVEARRPFWRRWIG